VHAFPTSWKLVGIFVLLKKTFPSGQVDTGIYSRAKGFSFEPSEEVSIC
jgi:hypothetical protein